MRRIFKFQKVRFIAVGGLNTLADFILFNLILWSFSIHPVIANSISLLTCMVLSFFLNHYFVFQSKKPIKLSDFLKFMIGTGIVMLVAQNIALVGSIAVLQNSIGDYLKDIHVEPSLVIANIAKLIAVGVSMVANYLLYKYVIFRHATNNTDYSS